MESTNIRLVIVRLRAKYKAKSLQRVLELLFCLR
jgi:hypothetical protein